ncbi:MAG: DUF1499 domain-containing protein [Silicimonas sp.]|nr:DUF1499 domain-containing protein [Silicimonas sp.]
MKTLLITLLALAAAIVLWIRYSPIDRDAWHVDPADAGDLGRSGVKLIGLDAPRFAADPETVLETIHEIALSEPRTRLLDGDIDEGMLTFVARSRTIGFADFITVKAVSEGRKTKLSVASRPRAGAKAYDWGVNAKRIDRWMQEMRLRLGQG